MKHSDILDILRSNKTVFSFKDILLSSGEEKPSLLNRRLYHYTKNGMLYHIRKGIYAKDKDYDRFELATKIFTPSYISFETVTGKTGITFQFYGKIFVASYQTKEINCDGQIYSFRTVRNEILINDSGIEKKENYFIATPERAFLDIIYLNRDYYFDNLSPLNWDKIYEILPVYGGNERMEKTVKRLSK
jgi:hypothetical protein